MFERLPMYDVQQVCEEGRVEGRKKDRVEESLNGPSRSVTITKDGV